MKILNFIFTVLISAMLSLLLAHCVLLETRDTAAETETVFERVMRTETLRCGYFSWYPGVLKNPQTGELTGIFYDYVNALGKSLSLKIEWVEEVALGEYPTALQNGRIDAFCSPTWITGARARGTDFIMPIYYLPLYAFARSDDQRFYIETNLNNPNLKMAILEGGATATIRNQLFPLTKAYELPQLTSPAELFISIAQRKADVAIYDLFTYNDFNTHNPDQVRRISSDAIKVFPNVMAIKYGEGNLRQMLSHATLELHLSGEIEKIIQRHETYPGAIYRMALPYQKP